MESRCQEFLAVGLTLFVGGKGLILERVLGGGMDLIHVLWWCRAIPDVS